MYIYRIQPDYENASGMSRVAATFASDQHTGKPDQAFYMTQDDAQATGKAEHKFNVADDDEVKSKDKSKEEHKFNVAEDDDDEVKSKGKSKEEADNKRYYDPELHEVLVEMDSTGLSVLLEVLVVETSKLQEQIKKSLKQAEVVEKYLKDATKAQDM